MIRALAALVLAGCLGPQVSDELGPSGDIVPAGTVVPPIDGDDAVLIAANDHVEGVVPLLSGFAGGQPVKFWDFGPAPAIAAPVFVVMKRMADGSLVELDHPPIAGRLPGEPGYGPIWSKFALVVTDAYAGELITATTAIDEAVRAGLVEAPKALKSGENYPVVANDTRLDIGGGQTEPARAMFYEHHVIGFFDLGELDLPDAVTVAIGTHYVLRREGSEPLSEPIRNVDLDGDGDRADSNDVLDGAPVVRRVDVAVVAGTASIDTSGNEDVADITAAAQLFGPGGATSLVVAYEPTDDLHDCAVQE
jgi:hypothetical protein